MEDIKNYKNVAMRFAGRSGKGETFTYDEASERVKTYLENIKADELKENRKESDSKKIDKNKAYFRSIKKKYREHIKDCLEIERFNIIGYEDKNEFINKMLDEHIGFSVLRGVMEDHEVTDVYVLKGGRTIYYEKNGENEKLESAFRDQKHMEVFLNRLLNEDSKAMDGGEKTIVDFNVYGDRACAIHEEVSVDGKSLTLRKHSDRHITHEQLLEQKVVDKNVSEILGMAIEGECNLICGGLTGSGKTTTMRAFIEEYITPTGKRVLVCEDTRELFLSYDHVLNLVTVKSASEELEVTLEDIIMVALRQKPKYIIIGEIRNTEALAAIESAETGHSTMFSMHGGNGWNIINRLTTKYMMAMPSLGKVVVERIIGEAIDYIYIQTDIPRVGRKVNEVIEVGYDHENERIVLKTILKYNIREDRWMLMNRIHPDKADKMEKRGIEYSRLEKWIDKSLVPEEIEIDFDIAV